MLTFILATGVVLHEGSDIKITGYLSRKHTMEGTHKKASQRLDLFIE